jgi:hypothetical protein
MRKHIVAYLLKASTVEAEKQPLLGNGPCIRSREMRHIRCDITQVFSVVRPALVANQRRGKHISAAVNQHATIEGLLGNGVFRWVPPETI